MSTPQNAEATSFTNTATATSNSNSNSNSNDTTTPFKRKSTEGLSVEAHPFSAQSNNKKAKVNSNNNDDEIHEHYAAAVTLENTFNPAAFKDDGDDDDDVLVEGHVPMATMTMATTPTTAQSSRRQSRPSVAAVGTVWNHDMSEFNNYLFKILVFKAEHGNYHIGKDEQPELHSWLVFLKKEFKAYSLDPKTSELTNDQIKVLQYLHIPLTSRGDDHWNRFYDLLKQWGRKHGHVLVPRLCEVPGLGDWVTDQRRQYKSWKQGGASQLTEDRRQKLDALGFAWQVRNRPEWDQRFQQLLAYKEKYGDCKVPQHFKENKALGKWVAKQREQFKLLKKGQHSFLTPYRLEKLNQAGFVWQVRTALDLEGEEDDDDPEDEMQSSAQAAFDVNRTVKQEEEDQQTANLSNDAANEFITDVSIAKETLETPCDSTNAATPAVVEDSIVNDTVPFSSVTEDPVVTASESKSPARAETMSNVDTSFSPMVPMISDNTSVENVETLMQHPPVSPIHTEQLSNDFATSTAEAALPQTTADV